MPNQRKRTTAYASNAPGSCRSKNFQRARYIQRHNAGVKKKNNALFHGNTVENDRNGSNDKKYAFSAKINKPEGLLAIRKTTPAQTAKAAQHANGMPDGLVPLKAGLIGSAYCFFFSRVCLVGLAAALAGAGAGVLMVRRAALASGSPFLAAS